MEVARKPQQPRIGVEQAELELVRPGRFVQVVRLIGIEPAPRNPVVAHILTAQEARQASDQCRARDLVVVDVQDPAARARPREERDWPIARILVLEEDDAIRDRPDHVGRFGPAVVHADHNLVGEPAEQPEDRGGTPGRPAARQHADRQRRGRACVSEVEWSLDG
jgi:hypothetical protein